MCRDVQVMNNMLQWVHIERTLRTSSRLAIRSTHRHKQILSKLCQAWSDNLEDDQGGQLVSALSFLKLLLDIRLVSVVVLVQSNACVVPHDADETRHGPNLLGNQRRRAGQAVCPLWLVVEEMSTGIPARHTYPRWPISSTAEGRLTTAPSPEERRKLCLFSPSFLLSSYFVGALVMLVIMACCRIYDVSDSSRQSNLCRL
ncbi:hypothetical protein V8C42DRAFT_157900 [Trichoderma barbatum]